LSIENELLPEFHFRQIAGSAKLPFNDGGVFVLNSLKIFLKRLRNEIIIEQRLIYAI
jgi:hypothetical protein